MGTVAFSLNPMFIAVTVVIAGTANGTIMIWHVHDGADDPPVILECFSSPSRSVAWSPDGKLIAAGSLFGKLIVFNTSSWELDQVRQIPSEV
ncbi:hypothetical protein MMC14_003164 [Varicellaria rhodocarpa]|nr:hypothetical protein [Varicellaria rhodocarpa]